MARMLELIREGKAPISIVRRAARGELALPATEAIAILALLTDDGELASEAEQTLREWDETSLSDAACDAATTPEVLRCLLRTQAERPAIIAALCGNPSLALEELESAAGSGGTATLAGMMRSARVRSSARLLELIAQNPEAEAARALGGTGSGESDPAMAASPVPTSIASSAPSSVSSSVPHAVAVRHARELEDEEDRPFELVTNPESEADPLAELLERARHGGTAKAPEEQAQLSLLQRIAQMRVGERIKLAMRGGREERMVLIRDRSKLVSQAVLASPKVDASEMESFAAMKNLQESVLRAIATNRKNLKNYGVVRTLVNNPKAPLDVALPLLVHLLVKDLRSLASNKNVNETVRKRAAGLYRIKAQSKKDS